MTTRLRRSFAGASEYVGGVFVAVLLLPIAPDVAVDLFGGSTPNWRNPTLRVGALVVVVFLVLVRFRARERARIRAARGGTMSNLGQAQVLALALRVIQEGQVDLVRPRLSCGDALLLKIAE